MRHRKKIHKLGKPADQRKALLRALITSLFRHDQIVTTLARAKAMKPMTDKIVTLAKQGDLHAIRQVARLVYHQKTGEQITEGNGKEIPETVLRRIFRTVAPRFKTRNGGYTRIIQAPPRRGDAAPMAVVELVN